MAITKRTLKSQTKVVESLSEFTLRILGKLKTNGYFNKLIMPIKQGKESVVYLADSSEGLVAVKIYRIENSNFNAMFEYLKNEPRYFRLSKQQRKVIFAWCEREFKNMQKAYQANISMPKPIAQKFNVIVMSYIGYKNIENIQSDSELINENKEIYIHAPKLREIDLDDEGWISLADKTMLYIKRLFDIGLVHGDLSEYNILFFRNEPYFIDFSHSTIMQNVDFMRLLKRDMDIVSSFFRRRIGDKIDIIIAKYKLNIAVD